MKVTWYPKFKDISNEYENHLVIKSSRYRLRLKINKKNTAHILSQRKIADKENSFFFLNRLLVLEEINSPGLSVTLHCHTLTSM